MEPGPGKPADVKVFVNGKNRERPRRENGAVPLQREPFDIGRDTVSPVSKDYKVPYVFQGRIEQVTIEVR